MPAIANITVKKNDGTTDIVYTAVSPSSGDKTAAVWKSQSVGSSLAFQPELRLTSRETTLDGKPARSLRATYAYPQVANNTLDGFMYVFRKATFSQEVVFPKDMVQTDVDECVTQFTNLMVSTVIRACLKSGYSAT